MDKYEYKLKLEQMKNLAASGDDSTAARIADSINWKRVRSASTLCMVGDIYSRLGRYENSRDMYLLAYDRSPIGRNIVYKLAEVAIKAGDAAEAEEYYAEFEELAANDSKKYILRYRISEMKGEPVAERIRILEELKGKEYSEEWAYELACLYQEAGDTERCVEACDELILWFGEGEYVQKALRMKRAHQSLTESQEEKYQEFLREHRTSRNILPKKEPDAAPEAPEGITDDYPEDPTQIYAGIPDDTVLNTEELETELRRSMDQIMRATEKDAVSDTMDTIKKMVGDFPKLQEEDTEKTSRVNEEILNKQINASLNSDFEEFLAEDSDGQISVEVPTSPLIEEQVPGQLSIEEVLAEWEKTKRAAEAALAVAEQKKLEVAKRKAIEEAQELIRRLQSLEEETEKEEILPSQTAGAEEQTPETEPEPEREPAPETESAPETEPEPKEILEQAPETAQTEPETAQELSEEELAAAELAANLAMMEEISRIAKEAADVQSILNGDSREETKEESEGTQETAGSAAKEVPAAGEEQDAQEEAVREIPEETAAGEVHAASAGQPEAKEPSAEVSGETQELPEIPMPEFEEDDPETAQDAGRPETGEQLTEEEMAQIEPQSIEDGVVLTEEQKQLFTYFLPVPGMEEQICSVLTGCLMRGRTITSITGNIIIQGPEGSGKTVLAASLIKCIQQKSGGEEKKIGKISAKALNKKSFASLVPKLDGGYVIIEKAGNLSPERMEEMAQVMEGNTKGLVVLMEDSKSRINALLDQNYGFAKKFTEKITIPVFTIDELVDFGKSYAEEMECAIDDMGLLALYNRINNIQKLDKATTLSEVREIIDQAIESAESGGIKKAFGVLFSKKYNENDYLILREKDFEL